MKRMLSLLVCCVMLACCLPAVQAEDAYAEAFTAGKTPELVKADLPAIGLLYGWTPLSLSSDEKTMLWRGTDMSLYLTRDGLVIPVKTAPDKGAGDPYEKLEMDLRVLGGSFPSYEGVAWSPDGKYAALTCKVQALQNARPMDLMVLDTETGEAYLAVALGKNFKDEHSGFIYEACFDHTGRYIYFLGRIQDMSMADSLFRFDMDTSEVQLVRENLYAVTAQSLFERSDGSWLVLGTKEYSTSRAPETVAVCGGAGMGNAALNIFQALTGSAIPVSGGQQYERFLPYGAWRTVRLLYSAQSGYGLMLGYSPVVEQTANMANMADTPNTTLLSLGAVLNNLCMNRITPEAIDMAHYWRFREENGKLRAEMVDDALVAMLNKMASVGMQALTDEEQETLNAYGQEVLVNAVPRATWGCVSPDGRYALLNVGAQGQYSFYLLDLVTMDLCPVNAPEGVAGVGYGTNMGAKYRPGMEWYADGTLLIYNTGTSAVEAYRLTIQ